MPYYIDEEHSDILFEVNGDQVAFKESNPGSGGSGGNLPYVIQEKDATTPTDRNLFSSKRVLAEVAKGSQSLQDEYLSKKKDDRTPHLLSSDNGFEVGEFVTGESGGKVWLDEETLKVLIELDRVTARQYIDIGEARLEYDSQNHAIRVTNRATDEDGNPIASIGLYAEGFVSAKGASSGGQGGGGGASSLYGLNDVLRNEAGDGVMGASAGKVLMFNGTHWYAGDAKGKVVAVKVGETEYKPSEEGLVTLPEFAKVVDKTITVDKFIGNLQGNADTATKLKNELTIWGQKFDGSANVSGAMTDVTSITIGDCVISYDSVNKGLKFSTGIYSEQYVSAKGVGASSSGVGGASSVKLGSVLYTPDSDGVVNLPAYPTVPTSLKNPYAITIQANGVSLGIYDGSAEKIVNLTHENIGAASATHKQAYTADACTTYTTDNENMGVTPAAVKKAIGLFEPKSHTHTISQVTDLAATLAKYYDSTISRIANTVLAAPNGSNGSATFRKLVATDIPSLDWSKITSGKPTTLAGYGITDGVNSVTVSGSGNAVTSASVSGHGLTLTKGETFLAKSVFDELFEKVLLSDGVTYAIRAKYGFYSDSFVSAKGSNSEISGGGGGIGSIYVGSEQYKVESDGTVRLPAYPTIPTSLKNPYTLTIKRNGTTLDSYDGSVAKEVNITVPIKMSELTNDSGFLTKHQAIYALTIQGNGTLLGTYTPNSEAKAINITYANVGAAAANHKQAYTADECTTYSTDDNTMGVTPAAVKKAIGLFDPKAHTHNSLGTLTAGSSSHPVYFNAGVPTAVDKTATFNAFVNSIAVGFDAPTDADYYISQYVGGGTENTTYRRRSHSALYTYIKNKAEGTWGINISGNAASATKFQTSRKIWGQAFDGSADVSGAMTGVTSITIGDCVITYDSANKGLKFSTGIYSEQYVSAKGVGASSSGVGGASSVKLGSDLYTPDGEGIIHLPAYPTVPTSLKNPYALTIQKNGITQGVYDGSVAKTVNITVPTKVSELTNDANYLTSHQTLYALTIQGNGTQLGVYTPNEAAKSINITAAGIGAAAATHTHTIAQVTGLQEALSDKYSSTVSRTANTVLAAPDDSDGTASFRKLVVNDLPSGVFHLRSNVSSLNDLGDYNKQNGLVYIHNESAPSLAAETPFAYGCVLNMNYDAASANIGISYLGDMYFRNRWWSVGGGSWYAWRKILHSYNYTDYTVKKDGTGASGTWGINVSGNAATATKLNNYYSTRPSNANLSPDGSGGMCKFLATSTMTSNKPAVDGHILHLFWDTTGGWDAQLMIPNNGNSSYEPQWRGQNNGTWGNWISLVTSGTIGNYNAGSATKLQTARTIWGQSFNGTANISGAMTGVTSITTNGSFSFYPVPSDTSNYYLTWGGSNAPFKMHNYGTITLETSTYIKMSANQDTMYIMLEAAAGTNINSPNAPALSLKRTTTDGGTFIRFFPFNQTSQYWMAGADWQYRFGIYYGGSTEVSFFDSSGNFATIGGVTAKASSSDIRLKRDLTEYDALSIVRSHRSVKYHWNMTAKKNSAIFDDDDWHYGLIAQELQREHPQLVKDVFGDYLTIDYERLIPILWRAVQQLEKRNEELEQMINERRKAT